MTQKQLAIEMINQMPEDASLDQIANRIQFIAAVQKGIDGADRGDDIPHEQIKRELATWLAG